jgi:hypothetical protein
VDICQVRTVLVLILQQEELGIDRKRRRLWDIANVKRKTHHLHFHPYSEDVLGLERSRDNPQETQSGIVTCSSHHFKQHTLINAMTTLAALIMNDSEDRVRE